MLRLTSLLLLLVAAGAVHAGNPGKDAQHCLDARTSDNVVAVENLCNETIFLIWCDKQGAVGAKCGEGADGGYYTDSRNLRPGQIEAITSRGGIAYGACIGVTGFGLQAPYRDNPAGGFWCLKN